MYICIYICIPWQQTSLAPRWPNVDPVGSMLGQRRLHVGPTWVQRALLSRYVILKTQVSWWRHQMETFSALLAICAGNLPVPGEFPAQRPVTRNFDVFFDMGLNRRLCKQLWGWWFETPSRSLWRHTIDPTTQPLPIDTQMKLANSVCPPWFIKQHYWWEINESIIKIVLSKVLCITEDVFIWQMWRNVSLRIL